MTSVQSCTSCAPDATKWLCVYSGEEEGEGEGGDLEFGYR